MIRLTMLRRRAHASPGEYSAHAKALPARSFVIIYCIFLFVVPSHLVVRQLGAPGTPANLWACGLLLWWVCATLGGMNDVPITPVRAAIGLLTLAVLASYLSATLQGWDAPANVHATTDEAWTLLPVTVSDLNAKMSLASGRGLISFAGWAGIALITCDGVRSFGDRERVVAWLTRLGAFVAAIGLVEFITGVNISEFFVIPGLSPNADFGLVDTRSIFNRVSATAVHPIEFSVVLAGIFPFALHRALYPFDTRLGEYRSRRKRDWIPAILIGTAVPMAVSRSGTIVLAVVFGLLMIGWPKRRRRRALLIAPVAGVVLRLLIPGLLGTIKSLFTGVVGDPSIAGRTSDYGVVFSIFKDHAFFGRGLFTFVPRYYRILDNQVLLFLLELGLVGFLVVMGLFVTSLYSARAARRRATSEPSQHLALVLYASLAGVLVSYPTFDAWSFPMTVGLTFLIIGLSGSAWHEARSEASRATTGKTTAERSGETAGANA